MKTAALFRGMSLSFCIFIAGGTGAQASQDPDQWPCQQAYVPTIPAAVVWAGPPVDELDQRWQSLPGINLQVSRLLSPGMSLSEAEKEIARFAGQQAPRQKDRMLTLLFAGILERLNADRSRLMSGILSYSRGQDERAQRLGEALDQIARLETDRSEAAQRELAELKESISIRQRMFDEREGAIQFLCARPILVEQRLGALARAIALHLD